MYLLTAVLPVYGISRNIENVKSILDRIPNEIQVIIAHDTTDGEDATQLKLLASSPNITVIDAEGGSAGKTRNQAMTHIKGIWTIFWDADDSPFPLEALEVIKDNQNANIDLIIGSFSYEDSKNTSEKEFRNKVSKSKVADSFVSEFGIWRCIFRSAMIENIRFNNLKIGEDLAFIMKAIPNSIYKLNFSNRIIYQYKQLSPGSITNSPLFIEDFKEAHLEISKIQANGKFSLIIKKQILFSLLLSQLKRFPSAQIFVKLAIFALLNPRASIIRLRELSRR